MITQFIKKVFGTRNERVVKKIRKIVEEINVFEPQIKGLSDDAIRNKTAELRQRYKDGATLDALLPEAFALVREASVRTLGLRHFDVQMVGGVVLHEGKIAEMRTGEGKTLVATLPAYLNALTGKGVHIITVNDYLAKRDAEWMGPIYNFLGLEVGVVLSQQEQSDKRAAYAKDITYGTNNEFGFDYLRDHMVFSLEDKVQRALHYAIVDEVDSILIDEARTPLIISGPADESSDLYVKINKLIPSLKRCEQEQGVGDYMIDEKTKQAFLTEEGHTTVEHFFSEAGLLQAGESLYDVKNIKLMHYLNAALRAHALFHRDVEYIVKNNQVVIVDEHTGRTMEGRRWSDGLHQAVEAKEGVPIQQENQTLASITFQNYFRLYEKLSGMTGTADTEAFEFRQIYGLEVIVIPTHMPMVRTDLGDQIYLTEIEKFKKVISDIKECRAKEQPVLVGTSSIETSEKLSAFLEQEKIPHQVLNAKQHEREAKVIAQAGQPGAVTIATNMAGRGTDIVLGGNVDAEIAELETPTPEQIAELRAVWKQHHEQVVKSGGLHVIGSERHESRRIDNQLRGRSGRQGDPGSSRFYLSLQDNLMRIFASDRVAMLMKRLGMKEDEAIEHPFITKAVENAQRKVEGHNFDVRKHLLEFDDVANEQRRIIYAQRDELMAEHDLHEMLDDMRVSVVQSAIDTHIPQKSLEEQWDIAGLEQQLQQDFNLQLPIKKWLEEDSTLHEESLRQRISEELTKAYQAKGQQVGAEMMRQLEKSIMLQQLDLHWKDHLAAMDHLRQGIHLRGYAQQNPKQEYKRVSFNMFTDMLQQIKYDVISILCSINIKSADDVEAVEEDRRKDVATAERGMQFIHTAVGGLPQPGVEGEGANAGGSGRVSAGDSSVFAGRGEGKGEYMSSAGSPAAAAAEHAPFVREAPKIGRNDLCYCGSGKKYKHCHGKLV
jgi:preprotein translocase subunit SecA